MSLQSLSQISIIDTVDVNHIFTVGMYMVCKRDMVGGYSLGAC